MNRPRHIMDILKIVKKKNLKPNNNTHKAMDNI